GERGERGRGEQRETVAAHGRSGPGCTRGERRGGAPGGPFPANLSVPVEGGQGARGAEFSFSRGHPSSLTQSRGVSFSRGAAEGAESVPGRAAFFASPNVPRPDPRS